MKKIIILAALTMVGAAPAFAVTIDFDGTLPTYTNLATYQEEGFTLTSNMPDATLIDDNNTVRQSVGIFSGGTNSQSIFWGANGETSTLSLSNDQGFVFDVLSLDASSLYNAAGVLNLSGTLAGGAVVTENLVLNGTISTYNLSNMMGLTNMLISFDGSVYDAPYDLDNIVMSTVPVPAAVWLFASGLFGLIGWSRRRAITS
ncbi:MAG: hypothetical protein GY886_11665 [Gammaproteobacteria bacterium]|nr:hypothetical protein [Gammaproteobacteria bacterium]